MIMKRITNRVYFQDHLQKGSQHEKQNDIQHIYKKSLAGQSILNLTLTWTR